MNETIETVAPDAQVDTEVIAAVSNAVADVNSVIADESIDPTSDTAAATVSAGQSELQESIVEVSSGGSDVTQFEEDTSSEVIFADVPVEDDAPDFDGDGIPDVTDPDADNDGVRDAVDRFPFDASESLDTDNDGVGNNTDTDDDNDGVLDGDDAF